LELEHLKIETRLISERFANAMGEKVWRFLVFFPFVFSFCFPFFLKKYFFFLSKKILFFVYSFSDEVRLLYSVVVGLDNRHVHFNSSNTRRGTWTLSLHMAATKDLTESHQRQRAHHLNLWLLPQPAFARRGRRMRMTMGVRKKEEKTAERLPGMMGQGSWRHPRLQKRHSPRSAS
jgi:hypothetical protein